MRRNRKPKPVQSGRCSAPNCPLRYRHATSHGKGFCEYHYGINQGDRVSEITRNIYNQLPVLQQIKQLNGLTASQLMGREPVPTVPALPVDCRQMEGESLDDWRHRLKAIADMMIKRRVA